ncbi:MULTISPECIES: hypothetical protein [unclassified Streptomyces]|uniref:hypothetical protein n=1 Tax=Streptomyces sp. NPDC007872 TaxID=3364782 RepID=UPI001392F3C0|nr:hypothetical protein [Streptomyces sp. SID2131]
MCHPAWARARTEAQRQKDLTGEEGATTTAEAAGTAGTAGQKAGRTAGRTGRPVPVVRRG